MISYVEGLGSDAMSDQFGIVFPEGIPGGGSGELLRLRLDSAFDEPEIMVETYEVHFEGLKIPKTGSENTDKSLSVSFRVDINWKVYEALRNWMGRVFNPITGAQQSEENTRTTMILNAYGPPNKSIVYSKRFNGVKIASMKITTFDYQNKAQPVKVDAKFIFVNIDELTINTRYNV